MTERRAHWSDDLIDNVADTLGVCVVSMMTVPDDIYEVIAAVEDWGSWPKFKLLDLVLARQRADKAEAQIQAVRELCDMREEEGNADGGYGRAASVPIEDVRDILDGRRDNPRVEAVREALHSTGGRVSCVCCDRIRTALDGAP